MRIAIADDEREMRCQLAEYIERFGTENGVALDVTAFSSGDELYSGYRRDIDVIIFDVDMPGTNGLDTARKIRKMDENVVIMFVTNIAQYAINGYEVEAIDYILKPVSYYDFSMKFKRAIRKVRQKKNDSLVLNTSEGPVKIDTGKILYVEVMDHYMIYHTDERDYQLRGTFKEHEAVLSRYNFSRCHKSYMVNLAHVKNIRSQGVILRDFIVPLGRAYKESLMEDYIRFLHG